MSHTDTIFIDMDEVDFSCPHCGKKYTDDGKYLERMNRNKSKATTIKCKCRGTFYLTADIKGNLVTYLR